MGYQKPLKEGRNPQIPDLQEGSVSQAPEHEQAAPPPPPPPRGLGRSENGIQQEDTEQKSLRARRPMDSGLKT